MNEKITKYNYLTSPEHRAESVKEASKIAYEIAELLSNKNISYFTAKLALDYAKNNIEHTKLGELETKNKLDN